MASATEAFCVIEVKGKPQDGSTRKPRMKGFLQLFPPSFAKITHSLNQNDLHEHPKVSLAALYSAESQHECNSDIYL